MTLIIRAITKNRTIYIADGRKTNCEGVISESTNKIVKKKDLLLIAFSGILDDALVNNRFNLINAFEEMSIQNCSNIILARQEIIDTAIQEYDKDMPAMAHKCHLMYSLKCQDIIHNENILIVKGKCYGFYHLKNSLQPFDNIHHSITKSGIQFLEEYINFIRLDFGTLKNNLIIDFNHFYTEGKDSMPYYLRDIIPHLFLNSIRKLTGNNPSIETIETLNQTEIDNIGYDFFKDFKKIDTTEKIGFYQAGRILENN